MRLMARVITFLTRAPPAPPREDMAMLSEQQEDITRNKQTVDGNDQLVAAISDQLLVLLFLRFDDDAPLLQKTEKHSFDLHKADLSVVAM